MNSQQMKKQVWEYAQKAYRSGLMAGTSGNFSMRDRERQIVAITPSSIDYETMELDDIVLINLQGDKLEGERKPSSEWQMHTAIYKDLPINAVAHTHAPYATAFAVLNKKIPVILIEMAVIGGDVPVAPFAMPGTQKLGDIVASTLKITKRYACLLENHGTLTVGDTMNQAYSRSIYLEDAAKIYHYSRMIGEPKQIADYYVREMMSKLGIEPLEERSESQY